MFDFFIDPTASSVSAALTRINCMPGAVFPFAPPFAHASNPSLGASILQSTLGFFEVLPTWSARMSHSTLPDQKWHTPPEENKHTLAMASRLVIAITFAANRPPINRRLNTISSIGLG